MNRIRSDGLLFLFLGVSMVFYSCEDAEKEQEPDRSQRLQQVLDTSHPCFIYRIMASLREKLVRKIIFPMDHVGRPCLAGRQVFKSPNSRLFHSPEVIPLTLNFSCNKISTN